MTKQPELLTSTQVCLRTLCSFRELDYWILTGLVSPTVAARGSGSQRLFDSEEVRWIETVVEMRAAGIRLDAIRSAVERGRVLEMLESIEQRLGVWRKSLPAWAEPVQVA